MAQNSTTFVIGGSGIDSVPPFSTFESGGILQIFEIDGKDFILEFFKIWIWRNFTTFIISGSGIDSVPPFSILEFGGIPPIFEKSGNG